MKKIVSSITIICMLLLSFATVSFAASFQPTIDVAIDATNDTIAVKVSVPANTGAAGGSFNLVYDPGKVELVDAVAGDIISSFSKTVNKTYATNKIRLNFAGSDTISAKGGVILTATFKLIGEGKATFSTEKFKLADIDTNYLTCTDASTSITISGDAPVPSESFTPVISAVDGKVGDTITVDVFVPVNTKAAGGSFNLVYDNTMVELVDAVAGDIISSFSKTVNKTYAENKVRLNFAGSDIISDDGGIILSAKFKLIKQGIAEFSTEKFKLADIDTNYLTCEDASQSVRISASTPATTFTPGILTADGNVGDTVTVKVTVPANTKAAGGSFNLVYDNTKVQLVDAVAGDIISSFSKTVNKTYGENKLRLNFAGSDIISDKGGVILTATFKLIGAGNAIFSVEKFKLADIDTNYLSCKDAFTSITISGSAVPDPEDKFAPVISAPNGKTGDTITVEVSVPKNTKAAGGSFNLVYDNTLVELVDAVAGDIISSFSKTVNKTYDENKVRLNFAGSDTISDNGGVILTATFKLIATGNATFATEKFKLADIDTNYLACSDVSWTIAITQATTKVDVQGVVLSKEAIVLEPGMSEIITATVMPENATNQNVIWSSSNEKVATVYGGKITPIAPGKTIITVTTEEGGYTDQCAVTVIKNDLGEDAPKITVSDVKTSKGKEVQVTVDLSQNTGFANLGIEIGYDAKVMTLIKVSQNTAVGATFTPAQSYSVNPFNMSWDSVSNVSYNGNLVTLTFKVSENAPDGTYPVTVDYYKGVNGNYTDGDNVNYDENFAPVGFKYVSGNVVVSNRIPGDINGDETVDNKDATYLLRYLAGWNMENIVEDSLDVDGNGSVDNKDATILLRYLAGWEVTLH